MMERFHLKYWLPVIYSCFSMILFVSVLLMFVFLNIDIRDAIPAFVISFFDHNGHWILAWVIMLMMLSPLTLLVLLLCSISWLKQHNRTWKNRLPLVLTLISQVPLLAFLIISQLQPVH